MFVSDALVGCFSFLLVTRNRLQDGRICNHLQMAIDHHIFFPCIIPIVSSFYSVPFVGSVAVIRLKTWEVKHPTTRAKPSRPASIRHPASDGHLKIKCSKIGAS